MSVSCDGVALRDLESIFLCSPSPDSTTSRTRHEVDDKSKRDVEFHDLAHVELLRTWGGLEPLHTSPVVL